MSDSMLANAKSPAEVIKFAKDNNLQILDLKFNDLPGLWQHFSKPISELKEDTFTEGFGFDGSSIRGFQKIQESDMLIVPDYTTACIDPVCKIPTLSMVCDIMDPITKKAYSRDPRYVAKKAEAFLKASGVADTAYFGPELEFFIFNDIRFDQTENSGYYFIDSNEGDWNSGRDEKPNLGYKPRYKEGYFPVPPHDTLQDIRSEIILTMNKVGLNAEIHHHEVATAGQCEIGMRFNTLVKMADNALMYKYIIKNTARAKGMVATFMPKPLFGDNGSGMHVHQSLAKEGKNLFHDAKGYAGLSQMAKYYIGGLLKHAPAILAFGAPSTNSYKRLVPGYEAPVNLVYSQRNRSASVRVPMYSENPKTKRIEFRPPDPSANPYLVFAAMLLAGLDGIKNKIEPPPPVDKNIFEDLTAEERAKIKTVPSSLNESLDALEADHAFLLAGDVFTKDLIEVWLEYKRSRELDAIRLRPHPYEFYLYFDV